MNTTEHQAALPAGPAKGRTRWRHESGAAVLRADVDPCGFESADDVIEKLVNVGPRRLVHDHRWRPTVLSVREEDVQ